MGEGGGSQCPPPSSPFPTWLRTFLNNNQTSIQERARLNTVRLQSGPVIHPLRFIVRPLNINTIIDSYRQSQNFYTNPETSHKTYSACVEVVSFSSGRKKRMKASRKKKRKQIGAHLDTIGSASVGKSDVFAILLTLGQVEESLLSVLKMPYMSICLFLRIRMTPKNSEVVGK